MRTCSSDVWKRSSMAYRTDVDQVDIAGSPTRIRTTRGATSSIGPAPPGYRAGLKFAGACRPPACWGNLLGEALFDAAVRHQPHHGNHNVAAEPKPGMDECQRHAEQIKHQ